MKKSKMKAQILDLSSILPEGEEDIVIECLAKHQPIPDAIKVKIEAAIKGGVLENNGVTHTMEMQEKPKPQAPRRSDFGPLRNLDLSCRPSTVTLTPGALMQYQVMQILHSYMSLRQPCCIYGERHYGFSVMTDGISMETLNNIRLDPDVEFAYFTDGNNATRLK